MVLVKNFSLVYFFVLSKFGLQRLFGDIVNRKLAFLHDILFVSYRWKNGHIWTKTMSFGNMSIFRLFQLLVFIAYKGVFLF